MAIENKVLTLFHPYKKSDVGTKLGEPHIAGMGPADAGMLALNFSGSSLEEKNNQEAALYAYDGGAWRHLNEAKPVTTQTIDLNTPTTAGNAPNPGAAWVAKGSPAITAPIVIATHGSPTATAYLLTDLADPSQPHAWTPLGSATAASTILNAVGAKFPGVSPKTGSWTTQVGGNNINKVLVLKNGFVDSSALKWSTEAQMIAGDQHGSHTIVDPERLRAELARLLKQTVPANMAAGTIVTNGLPSHSAGAGMLVALGADKKIATSLLSIAGLNFLGTQDMTQPVPDPTHHKNGDVYTHSKAVAETAAEKEGLSPDIPDPTWGFDADVHHIEHGDMALYDGTAWHHVATAADLTTACLKTHVNKMSPNAGFHWLHGNTAADHVIIHGGTPADVARAIIENVSLKGSVIQCGTF